MAQRTWAMVAAGKETSFESSSKLKDYHAVSATAAIKNPRPAIPIAYYMKRVLQAVAAERVRNAAFPKFNDLPLEIPTQIWEEASNVRRII